MSKQLSTRTRTHYGTSHLEDSNTVNASSSHSSHGIPIQASHARRNSSAPLMRASPIGPVNQTPRQPVDMSSTPLYTEHTNGPDHASSVMGSFHSRRSGLYRRRRKAENEVLESEEEEDVSDTELNTSDENVDDTGGSSDNESVLSEEEGLIKDAKHRSVTRQDHSDVRIQGFGDPLNDEWKQHLYLPEEDIEITIEGHRYNRLRLLLYRLCCIGSFGLLWLVARWVPQWWIAWVSDKVPLKDAEWLVFMNQYRECEIIRPLRELYGDQLGSVFSLDQIKEEMQTMAVDPQDTHDLLNLDEPLQRLILVEYRYMRLAFHPLLRKFLIVGFWKDRQWNSVKNLQTGLSTEKFHQRLAVFGPNLINIREKPIPKLLRDEVLNPFYVFQIGSIILWSMDDYYYYAFCIFLISAVSIVTTLVETKKMMKRMRDMSRFECSVRALRNGSWRTISSAELVPGDLIDITDLHTVPCDAILTSGDCILNESMLTGESVPVSKAPMADITLRKINLSQATVPAELTKHFMFMGTKVVRVRSGQGITTATALVVRTGFNTAKGALIRSMLFPKPNNFKFYRDSFRFIGVLAIIAAFGFLVSSINFIRLGIDTSTMVLRALDLITIVVPPALPATMSIGTSFAMNRLKKVGIFCISPPRVNIGGKIDCMCFDKTGTLTEDGLDIHGVRSVTTHADGRKYFDQEINTVSDIDPNDEDPACTKPKILCTMTTCHTLKIVEGELLGDPLDLKMFDFTRWELEESSGLLSTGLKPRSELAALHAKKSAKVGIMPTVVRPPGGPPTLSLNNTSDAGTKPIEFGIIHSFEFISALRRMSVIVRRLTHPTMEVFVKGAPEVMKDICIPDTMPQDYEERLYWYTHRGFRVIACASRQLTGVKWHKLHKLKRHEVESNLTFLGFIVFENKLKARTIPAITTLRDANIRQIMCTGDNVLTAVSVSRECGLIEKAAEVYIPRFLRGSSMELDSEIVWESVLQEGRQLDGDTLQPPSSLSTGDQSMYSMGSHYYLAVTGEAFRWMVDHAATDVLHRMLVKGAIYARMSPDEKQELVMELQNIGYCVGFCGDGANDCGALKAGDIGISLSEAEASVAAPFTSNTMDIECVIDVIKEGRAALVTSFSCFKYMALYSIIQFTTVTLLYAFGSNLGDFQFLYIDLFLILPIAVYLGYTAAWPFLYPVRPTASLVSKKVLTSLIGQIVINSGFQFIAYWAIHQQDWYVPPTFDPDGQNIECLENTVLFLLSSFQYILVAVVFSVGPPYRKPLWTNGRLVFTLAVLVTLTTWCTLYPSTFLMDWMQLEPLPPSFRWTIVLLAAANLIISYICEKWIFLRLAGWVSYGLKRLRGQPSGGYAPVGKKVHGKIYKRVMEEMGIIGNG